MNLNKKMEYWNHFIAQKKYHGFGVTQRRLEKALPFVLADKSFWEDVLLRHSGDQMTPEEMKANSLLNNIKPLPLVVVRNIKFY